MKCGRVNPAKSFKILHNQSFFPAFSHTQVDQSVSV